MARKHKPRKFWQDLIEEFENSQGFTQVTFAQLKNVPLGTFRKWLYQLRHENAKSTSLVSFVEVGTCALPPTPLPGGRLYLGQRVLFEFESLPEVSYLADLLSELE